mmetsp:Transcript_5905/g.12930  ORF Transcript_5905/g.12930 Transcript_5905/m.12930 type:complete len:131 (+) Transcript_5905:261-653(+)
MDEFADSPNALVADVDCTTEGKELCEKQEIRGYPSIKYGDPGELKDYQGGRTFDELKTFASENLGPQCGPGENIDLCDAETKAKIETYVKMSTGKLEGKVRNTIKQYETELPVMRKVLAYLQKQGGKGEL